MHYKVCMEAIVLKPALSSRPPLCLEISPEILASWDAKQSYLVRFQILKLLRCLWRSLRNSDPGVCAWGPWSTIWTNFWGGVYLDILEIPLGKTLPQVSLEYALKTSGLGGLQAPVPLWHPMNGLALHQAGCDVGTLGRRGMGLNQR